MTNFGNKFTVSFKRLGNKFERGGRKLGIRTFNAMGQSNPIFRKINNSLNEADKIAKYIPGGQIVSGTSAVANMLHKISKKSANKQNKLEKYNSRKAEQDKKYKSAVLKPGFI